MCKALPKEICIYCLGLDGDFCYCGTIVKGGDGRT